MTRWIPSLSGYSGHRYRALAEAIRDAILSGELPPDTKLMAHREMSWRLGVTAGTVSKAYKLLADWGLVYARIGDGTRVKGPDNRHNPVVFGETKNKKIDLGLLLPSPLLDTALRKQAFKDTLAKLGDDLMRKPLTGYGPELGYESHRQAGASFINDSGYHASPSEIIVTEGTQEAMHLVFSILAKSSDTIMTEEFGYLGFKMACKARHLNCVPISMDKYGIIPKSLEEAAKKTHSKLLFIQPNIQNPTGAIIPFERRKEIAEIANRCDFYIFEDNPFWAVFDDLPPPIVSFAPERTFYTTSLSKYVSPTLRVGYLRAIPKLVPALEIAKHALTLTGSSLQAEVAEHWVTTGIIYELAAWQRKEILVRWNIARSILGDYFPTDDVPKPFIWMKLPDQWRTSDFVNTLTSDDVTCLDSNHFVQGRGRNPDSLRIALTTPDTHNALEEGLIKLKHWLERSPDIKQLLY